MTRIVAIEPNPERAQALRQLVHDRLGADVVVAESTAAAITAMTQQTADLILTSILLPPNDDSQLTNYLRECDHANTVPVLLIPPVVEDHGSHRAQRRWWSRLVTRKRRGSPPWPPYDPDAVAGRIREAVASTQWEPGLETLSVDCDDPPSAVTALLRFEPNTEKSIRSRAQRWSQSDLTWLASVSLPTGREVKLLNISSSGILIDSELNMAPGRSTEFQLWGPTKNLIVAARIVRREEMSPSGQHPRYVMAAAFDARVNLED